MMLILVLLCIILSSNAFLSNRITNAHRFGAFRRSVSFLQSVEKTVNVGDTIVAEISDIGGSMKNPVVLFSSDDIKEKDIFMKTNSLSPTERLALQNGAVMQVYVSKIDGDQLEVTLNNNNIMFDNSYNSNYNNRNNIDIGNDNNDDDVSLEDLIDFGSVRTSSSSSSASSSKASNNKPKNNQKSRGRQRKPPGLLLNNLKTGVALEGVIVSCTHYAAFVNVGVSRAGKQGTYVEANGLLHRTDMSNAEPLVSNNNNGRKERAFELNDGTILERGSRVTVYVKEVYKQAGRFTVTLDGNIDKDTVLEQRLKVRTDGLERRRARRARRQLEEVNIGDSVMGVVDRVVEEGVLVTISSLGPLNITGLLGSRDLPAQFQVPADMKPDFRVQMLEQDFVPGREVSCSVSKISSTQLNSKYSLKLQLDKLNKLQSDNDLDAKLASVSVIEDYNEDDIEDLEDDNDNDDLISEDQNIPASALDDDDDIDEDLEDLLEVYNELCQGEEILPADNLRAWADLQDMINDGELTQEALDQSITMIIGNNNIMKFEQFVAIIENLQNAMDLETNPSSFSAPPPTTPAVTLGVSTSEEYDDEELREVALEAFTELAKGSSDVSSTDLLAWNDVKEIIDEGILSIDQVKAMIPSSGKLDFEAFYNLICALDEAVVNATDDKPMDLDSIIGVDDDDDNDDENTDTELLLDDIDFEQGSDDVVDMLSAGVDDDLEEELDEAVREVFDELRGSEDKVSPKTFRQWGDISSMIDEGILTENDLDEAIRLVAGAKNRRLNFEQFSSLVYTLDDLAVSDDDNDETDDEIDDTTVDINNIEDEEDALSDDEFLEVTEGVFEELSSSNNNEYVTISSLLEWNDIQEMISEGLLDQSALEGIIEDVGVIDTDKINKKQFIEIFNALDEATADYDVLDDDLDDTNLSNNNIVNVDDEVEEELLAITRDLYDQLRGSSLTLSMNKFRKWEDLKEMMDEGVLDPRTLDTLLESVSADNGEMNFDQFANLMNVLDEFAAADEEAEEAFLASLNEINEKDPAYDATSDQSGDDAPFEGFGLMNEDDDEDDEMNMDDVNFEMGGELDAAAIEKITRDVFNEIKGKSKTLSIRKFKEWDGIKELVETNQIKRSSISAALAEANVPTKGGSIDFDQFQEIMDFLDRELDQSFEEAVHDIQSARDDNKKKGFAAENVHEVLPAFDDDDDDDESNLPNDVEIAQEMYNDLISTTKNKNELTIGDVRSWDEMTELIETGALKLSTFERALNKITDGASSQEDGDDTLLNFDQFLSLIDSINDDVDESTLDFNKFADDNDDDDEDDDDSDARVLFESFTDGSSDKIKLSTFLEWEDLNELLECKALSKNELVSCIEAAGFDSNKLNSLMSFDSFYDLLQLVTAAVDSDKVEQIEDKLVESLPFDDSLDVDPKLEIEKIATSTDDEDYDDDDDDEDDDDDFTDTEVIEMFNDISKGLSTISGKQLMKWDELTELIDSGFADEGIVQSYFKKLDITADSTDIDLSTFSKFLSLLDNVILDDLGDEII